MVIAPKRVGEKAKESVVKTMEEQLSFFLREYTIVKDLIEWSRHKNNEKALKKMQGFLEQLEGFEWKQQLHSSVRKLKSLADRLIQVQGMGLDLKQEVVGLCGELYIFESKLYVDTQKRLEQHIKGKDKASEVDWPRVREIIKKELFPDLRALIALNRRLHELIIRGF